MSAGTAGPSGVKNLRAMFETKGTDQSSSPPSRGRSSPSGSISSANSRPVSKVRSSFVAVERPGEAGQASQWGLRKASDVSSMAEGMRENAIMEEVGENATLFTSKSSASAQDTLDLGAILKGSPFETSFPAEALPPQISKGEAEVPKSTKPIVNGTTGKASATTSKMQEKETPKTDTPVAEENKPARTTPGNINTNNTTYKSKESPTLLKKSPTMQRKPQSSPTTANGTSGTIKPRGGVNKILGVMQSAKKAQEERTKAGQDETHIPAEEKRAPTTIKAPSVASKGTAASRAHAQKQEKPKDNPQVKSPSLSRPVKLPSAATATTAASAARKGSNNEIDESKAAPRDRKSINVQAPRVASAATKASLAKKSSRASLASTEERARPRVSAAHKPADEGFLARMTRPTASSAQRAHDKLQTSSPPRTRKATDTAKKTPRASLNIPAKQQEPAKVAQSDETELLPEESVLEDTNGEQPDVLDDEDEGEPGPAEENDAYIEPQQAAVVNGAN